ncbi:regulatory protein RecX [Microbacterium koreense]|uniref:Regulatory protein RecX n=1 Tax=Microbacterium koreense TaxID=323761 RepID=A0ABW2ZT86_9MICO
MSGEDHRGDDLAPVIPLFGRPGGQDGHTPDAGIPRLDRSRTTRRRDIPFRGDDAPSALAETASDGAAAVWNDTWGADAERFHGRRPGDGQDPDAGDELSDAIDLAEQRLLRRLRTRSLSVREARGVLAEAGLPSEATETVIDRLVDLGYLDDAALAEHLVHVAVDRKGQGRQAIARTLAQRGVPRDVADAAIAGLPDDDAERALEFARSKARSMRSLDHDTALRRLSGQLARRGYGAAIALEVARRAIAELDAPTSGVRFR